MKTKIVKGGIAALKLVLSAWYAFWKLFPVGHEVVFLSREADTPSIDFRLLERELLMEDPTLTIVMRCHRMKPGPAEALKSFVELMRDVAALAGAKVAVCDTYSIPISLLHHRKELTVLQIWHALGAVKKFGKQIVGKGEGRSQLMADAMAMHKNYDVVTCTSHITAKYYAEAFGVPEALIQVRGMPRVDYIRDPHPEMVRRFYRDYPRFGHKPMLLYLPTFRVGGHPDMVHLTRAVDLEKYDLVIRLHPLDDGVVSHLHTVDDSYSTYDLMELADIIITDYSACSIEASILGKPVYFYVYDLDAYQDARGLNVNLQEEMGFAVTGDAKELVRRIEEEPYDFEALDRFCRRYVETRDINNTAQLAQDILGWVRA